MRERVLNHHVSGVNDRWLFIWVYPILAVLVVHIGNDNPLSALVTFPSYYSDLLLAFACTYMIGFYFQRLFKKMHQRFSWNESVRLRLGWHVIYGGLIPLLALLGVEILYLIFLLNIPLKDSSIFYLEMPVIATFCVLINLIYFTLYFRKQNAWLEDELEEERGKNEKTEERSFKEYVTVEMGMKSIQVPFNEVAYFMVKSKLTRLVTYQGQEYTYGNALEEVKKEVPPHQFFRLNRQVVANRKAILSYERTKTRKLKIHLIPESDDEIFVSKTRTPDFVKWIKNS